MPQPNRPSSDSASQPGRFFEALAQDLKLAFRTLGKKPAFTAVAVLTLALGVGANTAIFSVVEDALFTPPPYPEPDRLVRAWELNQRGSEMGSAFRNFEDWRDRSRSFTTLATYSYTETPVLGGERPVVTEAALVSRGFFEALGVSPALGRLPAPDEHREGAGPVAVVSDRFWRQQLGAERLDGSVLEARGFNAEVVGVMPPGFSYPSDTDIWIPLELSAISSYRTAHNYQTVGRLAPGVTVEAASRELDQITKIVVAGSTEPADYLPSGALVRTVQEQSAGPVRRPLAILFGAAALVLLVACSNLASTFLARGTERRSEIAVRRALGASAGRLTAQLFVESLLVAVLGAAAGLGLGQLILAALRTAAPAGLPAGVDLRLDPGVLAFTAVLALGTAVLFGLLPALRVARGTASSTLRSGRRGGGERGERRAWQLLVAAEVALALTLLVGSGLLVRSFLRMLDVDLGFTSTAVTTAQVHLPASRYGDDAEVAAYYRELLEQAAAAPGVEAAAVSSSLPLDGRAGTGRMKVEGGPEETTDASYRVVSGDYFEALGIPMLRGRGFRTDDDLDTGHVAIVSRALAEQAWPGDDAVGKRLHAGGMDKYWEDDDAWATVVGVVGDVRYDGPGEEARPAAYFHVLQRPGRARSGVVVARSAVGPSAIAGTLRELIREIDDQVPHELALMDERVASSRADQRFALLLLGSFAGVGLILALVGIYGVVALSVARRRRELGIRMALGADSGAIRGFVVRGSMAAVAVGLAVGTGLALGLTRLMETLLFEVEPTDPPTFVLVLALLGATALAASYLPARRTARIEPGEVMRAE